jgi:TonB family protein
MGDRRTIRLVIRARILPAGEQEAPVAPRWRKRALALVVAALAALVLMLGWVAARVFRTEPPSPPARSTAATETAVAQSVETASTVGIDAGLPKPPAAPSESRGEPDESPSTVNEVLPDVPRSALETIRGTVRVSIRVIVDEEGVVVAATPEEPGPSRYFERLALEASKAWTFESGDTDEQRLMLVRFNFTRAGVTAGASPLE